jgi:hypothetical protein
MPGFLEPLSDKFPIVDVNFRPTQYFIQWAQQRQENIVEAVSVEEAEAIANAEIIAWSGTRFVNTAGGLQGGGSLDADLTLSLTNTGVVAGAYTNADITVDAQGRITVAANGSGGGGGGSLVGSVGFASPVATTQGASVGQLFTPSVALSISAVSFLHDHVSGGTYRVFVAEVNAGLVVQNITLSNTITPTPVGLQCSRGAFASPVSLIAGVRYMIGVVRTDSTNIATNTTRASNTGIVDWSIPGFTPANFYVLGSNNPVIGQTFTATSSPFRFSLMVEYSF